MRQPSCVRTFITIVRIFITKWTVPIGGCRSASSESPRVPPRLSTNGTDAADLPFEAGVSSPTFGALHSGWSCQAAADRADRRPDEARFGTSGGREREGEIVSKRVERLGAQCRPDPDAIPGVAVHARRPTSLLQQCQAQRGQRAWYVRANLDTEASRAPSMPLVASQRSRSLPSPSSRRRYLPIAYFYVDSIGCERVLST